LLLHASDDAGSLYERLGFIAGNEMCFVDHLLDATDERKPSAAGKRKNSGSKSNSWTGRRTTPVPLRIMLSAIASPSSSSSEIAPFFIEAASASAVNRPVVKNTP